MTTNATTAKNLNLQDSYLNQVRKDGTMVAVYLMNGFQLRGYVKGFDPFTVILENDGKPQLIYKHAISTVAPLKEMRFPSNPAQV